MSFPDASFPVDQSAFDKSPLFITSPELIFCSSFIPETVNSAGISALFVPSEYLVVSEAYSPAFRTFPWGKSLKSISIPPIVISSWFSSNFASFSFRYPFFLNSAITSSLFFSSISKPSYPIFSAEADSTYSLTWLPRTVSATLCALDKIPLLLLTKEKVIPLNINITIIVMTPAIIVIPVFLFIFFPLLVFYRYTKYVTTTNLLFQ